MATIDKEQMKKMRWVLFYIFASIFVIIVLGTLLMIFFGVGELTGKERDILFHTFIVEVGIAVIALFRLLFNLKKAREKEETVPDFAGTYEYEIATGDKVLFLGECQIKQRGRSLSFTGERKKRTVENKEETVSIPWFSQWAEFCLDNKIRLDYSLTVNGGIRGYAILNAEAGFDTRDAMVGEFHLLEQDHICGTVRFKRRLSKGGRRPQPR